MERALTGYEQRILERLLEPTFRGRDQLRLQLKNAKAIPTNDPDNYGSIYLKVNPDEPAKIKGRIPVEGLVYDEDGVPISILLHVIDGLANELEIFKTDGSSIKRQIRPDDIKVTLNKRFLK